MYNKLYSLVQYEYFLYLLFVYAIPRFVFLI